MNLQKSSLTNLKVDPETLKKVGYTAVGLGSALLIATDANLRSHFLGGLKSALEKAKNEAGAAPADKTPKEAPVNNPTASYSGGKTAQPGEVLAGVVYLLKAGPFFKIGKTINMEQRLKQIKLQLPYSVEVVHVIKAAEISHVETYWHRRFASRRQNGEWFVLTEEEVAEFKGFSHM